MANQSNRGIYNGSAAYDLYRQPGTYTRGSAAPQIQRPELPDERTAPQHVRRVKAKLAVAPFALVGLMAAACMLILVVFGYVQLYEATEQVGRLENELVSLREDQAVLESLYEGSIDLSEVELRAAEMGLSIPTREQSVYINLAGDDRAEIFRPERTNWAERILRAFQSSAGGLVEYLS